MFLELFVLIVSVFTNGALGLAVYLKNPSRTINRLFFGLSLSLNLWLVVNYVSIHPFGPPQIFWVRFVLSAAALLCLLVLLNFQIFPEGNLSQFKLARPAVIYAAFVILLTQSPFVFKELNYSSGSAQPVVAPGIIFFMALAFFYLGGAITILIKKYRRSSGQSKNQLRIVLFGVVTTFSALVITNFILVSFFKNTSLLVLAPAFTLFFIGSMTYAILKLRLFDLRAVVARSMAYILTLTILVIFYGSFAFLLTDLFANNTSVSSTTLRTIFTLFAVITALIFQPVRHFFDKITDRFFFRDAYDPQALLNDISSVLVANIELEKVLQQCSLAIAEHMKVLACDFIIDHNHMSRIIGNNPHNRDNNSQENLHEQIRKLHQDVVVYDELSQDHTNLKVVLSKNQYAVLVRLSTKTTHIGYMAVSDKRSGDVFNIRDLKVLKIAADEIAIATENALRFEEIQNFNLTLQQKVDDATRKLRQTNEKLKALDETKDEFISMASHQLRTPLTSVKGYISMVVEGDAGKISDTQKQLLDQAFNSAQRMVFLIADLLNVSRLKTGKFVIERKPTQLADVIESEITQLKETAKGRKLELTYEKPKDFPVLMLDETKIRQVIMNFADNAIYYTQSGLNRGHIKINLEDKGNSVEFTVVDDGIGVPKEAQHHLFTKFYRAGNAQHARPDGTGLGLFMAKKVVVAQGGSIIFHSEEGKGSTFGFNFPKAKLLPPVQLKPTEKTVAVAK